jgi:glycosyltransferase involved in cell wall biosynthesis
MRVLFVAPELPRPPYTGAHTRPLSIMHALAAAGHEIVAVGTVIRDVAEAEEAASAGEEPAGSSASAVGPAIGADRADLLYELCSEVVALPATGTRSSSRAWLSRGRKALSPVPLIGKGYNAAVGELVAETAARVRPHVYHLQTMYAAHYAPAAAPAYVPTVVDLTDVVSGLCETAAQARRFRFAAARLQAASSRRQEQRLLSHLVTMTINDDDRERLLGLGIAAYTVPLAIELPDLHGALLRDYESAEEHAQAADMNGDRPVELLFVGSMLHAPNREAALFLVQKVAPELRRAGLAFRLTIAGRDARPAALGLHRVASDRPQIACSCGSVKMEQLNPPVAATGIEFCPDAPDLTPLYRRADIVLAPLPHGGGTKNKTLEAMAYSRPVVGTPQAFTGLSPDARAAYAETPYDAAALAASVADLAAHPLRRIRMARCGREYVAAHHSQVLVNRRVRVLYDAIGRGEGVAAAEAAWKDRAAQSQV